ncbi:choice-of-anchor Q domain-containing protein [Runella aurantiaca]|nr:choice-of-anchor Q domain-containing protein [Runella aurantiaca]
MRKFFFLCLIICTSVQSWGVVRYVNASVVGGTSDGLSWPNAYNNLHAALTAAQNGDQIWVAQGIYYPDEGGSFANDDRAASFTMKNGVAIYGGFSGNGTETMLSERNLTANTTILSGEIQQDNDASNNSLQVIRNYSNSLTSTAVLDGFTITGGNAPTSWGGGMLNFESSPSLSNITFSGNSAQYGGGMFNHNSTPSLSNVTFSGNSAEFGGGMFSEASTARASLSNVTFSGNSATINGGGMFNVTSSPSLSNVTFSGNTAPNGGAMYNRFANPVVTNCILWGNSSEIVNVLSSTPIVTYSIVQGGYAGTGNLNVNPLFVNAADPDGVDNQWMTADDGLRLSGCSPAINTGTDAGAPTTDILGNARVGTTDMGAYEFQGSLPTTLYVNQAVASSGDGTSWATAFKTLQEALQLSCSSVTQIWVAKGTYYPDEGGSFANNDRAASFTMKNGVAIYGGFSGNGNETMLSQRNWAANPTILSGDIDKNNALDNGNSYNVIFNNNNGLNNSAVLDGFTITGGLANGTALNGYGGGMCNFSSSPSVTHCSFSGNQASDGGGMYNNISSPTLTHCSFSGNQANAGGGMANFSSSSPTLTNCSFSGNLASGAGGMYNEFYSSPTLTNCSFSGNMATYNGGGMYNNGSCNSTLRNCILWGNSTEVFNQPDNDFPSNPTYTNTLVKGLNLGSGVFDGTRDPLFVSQPPVGLGTAGNLRLRPCSPAINVGDNTLIPSGIITDLDGNPRVFNNGIVDLGAYEYQGVLQEINLQGGSPLTNIPDGDNTPTAAKGTDFGNVSSNGVQTFTIQNTGSTPLNISSIVSNNALFTVGALSPASPIAAGGSATFTVTFSPTATGVQNATITVNNNDCDEAVYDFAVTGNAVCPAITINAPTVTQSTCTTPTGAIVVNATGSGTLEYSIDNGSTWQSSATFGGLAAGNYAIKVRSQAFPTCTTTYASNPVVITLKTPPSVDAGSCKFVYNGYGSNCTNLTASATGAAGGFTYNWSPGNLAGATVEVCPTVTTTYTVTVTDANGCTSTDEVTVEVIDVHCGNSNAVEKVLVCFGGKALCVAPTAVPALLANGATLGACGITPCGTPSNARIGVESDEAMRPTALMMQVYPNPTAGLVTVDLRNVSKGLARIEVVDLIGRPLVQKAEQMNEGANQLSFDLKQLPDGLYLIRCRDSQNHEAVVKVNKL